MNNRLNKKQNFIKQHLNVTNFKNWVDGTDFGLGFECDNHTETFTCCDTNIPYFQHHINIDYQVEGIEIRYSLGRKIRDKFHRLW